jgi:hypothetical protein
MLLKICRAMLPIILALPFLAAAKAEIPEGSAAELFQIYDRSDWETRKQIEKLLAMTENGLKSANTYLTTVRNEPALFCQPEKLELTGHQLMKILRDGVKADESLSRKPWGFALLVSLQGTFSCRKSGTN